uniref:MFS domain-containing protein n=1 Tax=Rhabditophanes sp. KR3021 TaxID=114890 RepID=A0AC35UDA2_9BILA
MGLIAGSRYVLNLIIATADINFKWLGRRVILITFLSCITLSFLIIALFHIIGIIKNVEMLVRVLQIGIVCFTAQLYASGAVLSSELYPTAIRNMGYSVVQVSSRIGGILSAYLFYLSSIGDSIPYLLLASLTFITTISFFFTIPETKGKPLNEKMPSKEECIFGNKKKKDIEMSEKESEKMLAD